MLEVDFNTLEIRFIVRKLLIITLNQVKLTKGVETMAIFIEIQLLTKVLEVQASHTSKE